MKVTAEYELTTARASLQRLRIFLDEAQGGMYGPDCADQAAHVLCEFELVSDRVESLASASSAARRSSLGEAPERTAEQQALRQLESDAKGSIEPDRIAWLIRHSATAGAIYNLMRHEHERTQPPSDTPRARAASESPIPVGVLVLRHLVPPTPRTRTGEMPCDTHQRERGAARQVEIEWAMEEVAALAAGPGGTTSSGKLGRAWRMCIPVQPDDSDVVLMAGLKAGLDALNESASQGEDSARLDTERLDWLLSDWEHLAARLQEVRNFHTFGTSDLRRAIDAAKAVHPALPEGERT